MPSVHRHPLHRLNLRNAQVLSRQRVCWETLRDRINALRSDELKNVIATGVQTEKDIRLGAALDRMYEVRESQPIFKVIDVDMRLLQSESSAEATGGQLQLEQLEIAQIAISSLSIADSPPVTPPGVTNLRQTPRRPGAPSAVPVLINSLSDQCGSACAAPEIRFRLS